MKVRKSKEGQLPSVPISDYFEARPLLRHVRVMERVMDWADEDPKTREFHAEMHCAYMDILSEEMASHALTFALAIAELEDAFPEIAALVEMEPGRRVQDESAPPTRLKIVPRVTREHGTRFARKWLEMQLGEMRCEAFAKADVIEWPSGPDGESTPAQDRFQEIEDEILDQTFAAVMPAVDEAFVKAARAILARERGRN
jgi:hypothetical protein